MPRSARARERLNADSMPIPPPQPQPPGRLRAFLSALVSTLVPAAATAVLAALAWAVGASQAWAGSPLAPWPLGAVMLGWLTSVVGQPDMQAPAGAAEMRRASALRALCALFAALAVGTLEGLASTGWHAARTLAAGVLLPALAAEALARLAAMAPPRGVGVVALRLLGTAVACAPLGALLRGLQPGAGSWSAPDYPGRLVADILAATICVSLASSLARSFRERAPLAQWLPARVGAVAAADTTTAGASSAPAPPTPSASPLPAPSARAIALSLAGIAACVVAAAALRATGQADLARGVAVAHLVLGLLVARSMSGTIGALVLALNAIGMTASYTGAFMSTPPEERARVRELGALLMLGGIFAMQSVLHSVSTDSREAARALIRQAMRSDLSGLPNHRALARIVGALLARPRRQRFWLVGVVLPDIARWSDLIDSAASAELERSVAGRLRASFEPLGARVAHPSSGRFVLTIGDRVDGLGIRQRLRAALGSERFDTNDQSIQLRYNAGMVEVPANAQVGADAVLTTLSMALQRAASEPTGIHRATVSAELVDGYRTELRTIEAVSRALSEGRIRLFAERIEPARPTGRQLLHFEVLVRLQADDGRLMQPGEFLPAIWHAGLHGKLDRLVFIRTIAHLAANPLMHDALHRCSINVCGPTLCDPDFPDFVQRGLETHRVDPRRLMIEITESSAIADLELAREHVGRLAQMGLAIALDDFGTGLATFDYLKRLRADVLKIDGSFIRRIVEDPLDREIVATIVRIARATGARTVAEWIETPEQRAIVVELGVDDLQGRLIAAAVPLESLRIKPAATSAQRIGELLSATTVVSSDVTTSFYEHGQWNDRPKLLREGSGGARDRPARSDGARAAPARAR
jgi:EAL domain-containing protein (putative c-di-GMP-specific phosphodiesterase class I)/GGDEF domain-containing protein